MHVRLRQEQTAERWARLATHLAQRERSSSWNARVSLARVLRTVADQLDSEAVRQQA